MASVSSVSLFDSPDSFFIQRFEGVPWPIQTTSRVPRDSEAQPNCLTERQRSLAQVCQPLFESRYLGREPFVLSGLAHAPLAHFDWSRFDSVLASVEADVIVTKNGNTVRCETPTDLEGRREHFGRGHRLTAWDADRCCSILRALAESVRRELGTGSVSVSAIPTGSTSTWCYGDHRQFFVQAEGVQNYYFRPNTVAAHRPASTESFSTYRTEASRLWMARLSPGDVLYLPARWWQKTDCVKDSLTIDVCVPERSSSLKAFGCLSGEEPRFESLASTPYQAPTPSNLSSSLVS